MTKTFKASKAEQLWRRLLQRFRPPPRIKLSEWSESNIVLPEGHSARPGKYRNWPYFVEIIDSIGDLTVERVTLMKSARLGFTKGVMIAMGANVVNHPGPIALLVPTEQDAREIAADELEPMIESNPVLGNRLRSATVLRKKFMGGASIKVLSARSPRNLRRHDVKYLYCDEVDAMEITVEGDPIKIAERRTMAHPDRKIVIGSTPTEEGISIIERGYEESDKRIFEICCYHCEHRFELLWEHIQWQEGQPETATAFCPGCGAALDERRKRELVEGGRWRATRPEVVGHRGYRINALVSLLTNAAWPILAKEFLQAKRGGPSEMQPFFNTVLAKTWKTSIARLNAESLKGRAESFGLDAIPSDVLMLTVGADVQDDRIECTVLGWPYIGAPYALGHVVIPGNTLEKPTWDALDAWLKSRWPHPNGWLMSIDACAIDSGGSKGRTQKVYDFCDQRKAARRIFAVKGAAGERQVWQRAARVKDGHRLFLVGHDATKTAVLEALARPSFDENGNRDPHSMLVSDELPDEWFDQATGEVRRIRYVRNRAVIEFVPKRPGQRVEALDTLVYAWAVRFSPEVRSIDLRERAERKGVIAKPPGASSIAQWAKHFNQPRDGNT